MDTRSAIMSTNKGSRGVRVSSHKWLLNFMEMVSLTAVIFAGWPFISMQFDFIDANLLKLLVSALCLMLHFVEYNRGITSYGKLFFRPVPCGQQGCVTAAVTAIFCFGIHIVASSTDLQIDGSWILPNYKSISIIYARCIIAMFATTICICLISISQIEISVISLIIIFLCYFFQDHFDDLESNIVLLSIIIYLILFWNLNLFCPRSFTIGESVLVCQGSTILFIDFICLLIAKTRFNYLLDNINITLLENRSQESILISTLLVSAFIISVCLGPVFYCLAQYARNQRDNVVYSLAFYAGGVLNFVSIFCPLAYLSLGVNIHLFLLSFLNFSAILLGTYWAFLVILSVTIVFWHSEKIKQNNQNILPNIIIRKIFHFIAVLIFVPGIFFYPEVIKIASCIAIISMIIIEYIRIFQIYPFGGIINAYLKSFVDEKDAGPLILTHIYLLLGFSLPLWVYSCNSCSRICILAPYAGVICLGVGDAFASIFGTLYGKLCLPGSKKTFIGTSACICSQLIVSVSILLLHSIFLSLQEFFIMFLAILCISLIEAITSQVDNLILPPILYGIFMFICSLDL